MDSQMKYFKERLNHWAGKIKEYQDNCPHTNHTKVAGADTGNFCPQDDSYWYDIHCPDCDKQWREDQDEYRRRMRRNEED